MSRIGKTPIALPKGVEVSVEPGKVHVKGPKGELTESISDKLEVRVEGGHILVSRPDDERESKAQHGLARTLINNMVVGVTQGYKVSLDVIGVGYSIAMNGKGLTLKLGYSHPINVDPIPGIEFAVEVDNRAKINRIHVSGPNKQQVGQVAANLRELRAPEPYKGKGIRYVGEVINMKAGKAGKTGK
ncbi:50S ribosomal protein L6 [bacterium]|nr:50S ribosomal protein L6 [bacterium]